MSRADLLALTPEVLAALTNRGLLRRATKAVTSGAGPTVATGADGTVSGDHPDGVRTSLPAAGGLDAATCTCGATSTCRHVLTLVLAYQAGAATESTPQADASADVVAWSPAEFSDEAVEDYVGVRPFAAATRMRHAGYAARVRRPTPDDPVPRVELPSCTVRFLVPHDLSYAHTDAAPGAHPEAVALAVWAYRVADAEAPAVADTYVQVGDAAAVDDSGFGAAIALAGDVLLEGAVTTGPALATTIAVARRDLDAANFRWPLLALDDLAEQLTAYADRSARYRPERLAELVAELHARHRAVTSGGASPRSRVLGTEEAAETPLRRLRLASLGCRITGTADERTAQVFLAHADTATVLVLRQDWPVPEDSAPTGHDLAAKRVAGTTLAALAGGNLVTESAVRSASRRVRLATGRIAKSTISPSTGGWDSLPDGLVVRDFAAAARAMDELPPRLVRPRVDAESVRAVAVSEVLSVSYSPGDQRLDAVVGDRDGNPAVISAGYRAMCPAALDTIAAALTDDRRPPRFVSGVLHRTRGSIVIDPVAVVAGDTLIVPDLAPGDGSTGLAVRAAPPPDGLTAALDTALGHLAEVAHRGARHLPATFPDRLRTTARALTEAGLVRGGAALATLADTLGPAPGDATVQAWVDAQVRLLTTAEHLAAPTS